jgi:hypothetical protein
LSICSESERLADDGCPNHDPNPGNSIDKPPECADLPFVRVAFYLPEVQATFFRSYLDYLRTSRNLPTDAAAAFAALEQVVNAEIHL